MEKIRIGIFGYGNLGRGVSLAASRCPDIRTVGIFTRRNPETVKPVLPDTPVFSFDRMPEFKDKIDVMILCGGSAKDLPEFTPKIAADFNTVDSFDNHSKIPEYFAAVDSAAKQNKKTAIISVGWDPGLFSINRLMIKSILPESSFYTFWGPGVSQGHSDAIRRVEGVADARQYTVPSENAIKAVRSGENPNLTAGEKHSRVCFVVLKEGADAERVEREIKTMPGYFADYETEVNFISKEELAKNHSGLPHGGFVIGTDNTGVNLEHKQKVEFSLSLGSNPEFTSSVLTAYARAAYRLSQKGETGAKSVFDVAPAMLSPLSAEEIRAKLL